MTIDILQEFRSRLLFSIKTKALFYRWKHSCEFGISFLFCEKTFGDLVSIVLVFVTIKMFMQKKGIPIMHTRQSMACGRVDTSRKLQRASGNHFESNLLCACGGNFAHFFLKKWLEFSYLLSQTKAITTKKMSCIEHNGGFNPRLDNLGKSFQK